MADELKQIMFVDDDEDIREIANIALSSIGGFSVTMCGSGEEALQKVSETKPQLIILDVMMPGMDGPATFKQLQLMPEVAKIPVLFITAKVRVNEVASYKAMGVFDVIAKPFDPMILSETLLTLWKRINITT